VIPESLESEVVFESSSSIDSVVSAESAVEVALSLPSESGGKVAEAFIVCVTSPVSISSVVKKSTFDVVSAEGIVVSSP